MGVSHYEDMTVSWPPYLCNENPYTWKDIYILKRERKADDTKDVSAMADQKDQELEELRNMKKRANWVI